MKPTIPTLFLAATLCASALVMPVARAQISNYYTYKVPIDFAGMNERRMALDASSEIIENTGRKSVRSVRRTPKVRAVTTYRASRAVSQRVQTRLIAFVVKAGNSPATVAQLKRDLQGNVIGKWARQVASDGLRSGDVADAMAANWVQNWQVANGVMETQPAQVRGVRRQLAAILADNAAFAKVSNAGRQEMAEGFIYSQVLQGAAYLDAIKRGDKTLQKQISDATSAGFKKGMGLDLRGVQLTDTGFKSKA